MFIPMSMWVLFGFSCILPQSKTCMLVIGELETVYVNERSGVSTVHDDWSPQHYES